MAAVTFARIPKNETMTIQNEINDISSMYKKRIQNIQGTIEEQENKLNKIQLQLKKVSIQLDSTEAKRVMNEKTFSKLVIRKNSGKETKEGEKYVNQRIKQTRKLLKLLKNQGNELKSRERLLRLKRRNTNEYINYLQKRMTSVGNKYNTLLDEMNKRKNDYVSLWNKYVEKDKMKKK